MKRIIFVYYSCRNYLKKSLRICLKNQLVICTLPDLWDILLYSVDEFVMNYIVALVKVSMNIIHIL